jgi:Ca2+-binding EF-hand superfamily protein
MVHTYTNNPRSNPTVYFQTTMSFGYNNDRVLNVFDKNKNEYLDTKEFIQGMTLLFSEIFQHLVSFMYKFYEFDRDGFITKEDVRVVLSYVPLQKKY